jgi:phage FluMu protein Com
MLVSILITFCISSLLAMVGYFTGGNPIQWFGISLVLQYVVFFIINTVTKAVAQMHINRLEVQRLNAIDENRVRIKCAVCGEPHDIIVKVGQTNEFRCERCKSLNTVTVSVSNFQKTEIAPDSVITEDTVNKLKEKLNEQQ